MILIPNITIIKIPNMIAIGNQIGDSTHHQDQVYTEVPGMSFNTIKIRAKTERKGNLFLDFSVVDSKLLFKYAILSGF